MRRELFEGSYFRDAVLPEFNKANHLTAYYTWDSEASHLTAYYTWDSDILVISVQLMTPATGPTVLYTVCYFI